MTFTVPETRVDVRVVITKDWQSGYQGAFEVRNDNAYDILDWTIDFKMNSPFSWLSDADVDETTLVPKEYARKIKAGATRSIQFGGAGAAPEIVSFSQILPLVGEDASDATRGSFGSKAVAPYVDACAWPTPNLETMATESGIRFFTLAFITAGKDAAPSWAGIIPLENMHMLDQIRKIRSMGGDVSISFGGANGVELAQVVPTVPKLVEAYRAVIDMYGLKRVDFDIEGGAVADVASVDRRNKAIAQLQKDLPDLHVSYCLPVLPIGLTFHGMALIENARKNGVRIDTLAGMTMDAGASAFPNPKDRVADGFVIPAALALKEQAESVGYVDPRVGVIPMIGVNDVEPEVFTLVDAAKVVDFVRDTPWMNYVGWWSMNRDRDDGTRGANPFASGIPQKPWDFSRAFGRLNVERPQPEQPKPPKTPKPSKMLFAPYVESWLESPLVDKPAIKNASLASVVADEHGAPSWDGTMPLERFACVAEKIRAKGGNVRVSLGGSSGKELARVLAPTALLKAYKTISEAYGPWFEIDVDFDSEDIKTTIKRANALNKLQIRVDVAIRATTVGTSGKTIKALKAISKRVPIHLVNVFTHGSSDVETILRKTKNQLRLAGIDAPLGLTPTIGKDGDGTVFTLEDAARVAEWASETPWIHMTSFWTVGRDTTTRSGIKQKPSAFAQTFAKFLKRA